MSLTIKNSGALGNAVEFSATKLRAHVTSASRSVDALSSGRRIQTSGEDVASLAVGTQMNSKLRGVREALLNATRASLSLSTADGAMSNIIDMLARSKALAVSASNATLSDSERAAYQLEQRDLQEEIDRIAHSVSFGSHKLLASTKGSGEFTVNDAISYKPSMNITLTSNPADASTLRVQGLVFSFRTTPSANPLYVTIGATVQETATNLATKLAAHTDFRISRNTYSASGATVTATSRSAGPLSAFFAIDETASTAAANVVVSGNRVYETGDGAWGMQASGPATGISYGDTAATGSVGNTLLTDQQQTKAEVRLDFTGNALNNQQLRIDNGLTGTNNFVFRTTPTAGNLFHIQIGSTIQATIDNAIRVLNTYSTHPDALREYANQQLEFLREGNSLVIRSKVVGNPLDIRGAAIAVSETLSNATLTAATLNNGIDTGVNASGIINPAFVGRISGFTATRLANDRVLASLTVGEHTYRATITDTTPAANTRVRFLSDTGGYFDMMLRGGAGLTVNNSASANTYASRLNQAFSTLDFFQRRIVSNADSPSSGPLAGAQLYYRNNSFDTSLRVNEIDVSASAIRLRINDEWYATTTSFNGTIDAGETITLQGDGQKQVDIVFGNTATNLNDDTQRSAFTTALSAFLPYAASAIITGTEDTPTYVHFANATSDALFEDTVDLSMAASASASIDVIESALMKATGIRSSLGATQQQLSYNVAQQQDYINNLSASISSLLDTDFATEGTAYVVSQVLSNLSISILAQTNQLQNSLLSSVYDDLGTSSGGENAAANLTRTLL